MIGGSDIVIPVDNAHEAMELAVRAIVKLWPSAVIEDANTGDVLAAHGHIDFVGRDEILAFKDSAAARLWDEIGADPKLEGTLVHFLSSSGTLTIAVDEKPPEEIRAFVRSLRDLLELSRK